MTGRPEEGTSGNLCAGWAEVSPRERAPEAGRSAPRRHYETRTAGGGLGSWGKAAVGGLEPAPRDGPATATVAWEHFGLASAHAQTHCTEKRPHCREQPPCHRLVPLLPEFSRVRAFLSQISPYSVVLAFAVL